MVWAQVAGNRHHPQKQATTAAVEPRPPRMLTNKTAYLNAQEPGICARGSGVQPTLLTVPKRLDHKITRNGFISITCFQSCFCIHQCECCVLFHRPDTVLPAQALKYLLPARFSHGPLLGLPQSTPSFDLFDHFLSVSRRLR